MMLILLTTLVAIVFSESSLVNSDNEVNNDVCNYSEVKVQPFRDITNSSLRSFLLSKLRGIANNDCVQSYQVQVNDNSNPFHVFRIDRQTRFSQSYSVCGVVTVKDGDFMWTTCDKTKFEKYLLKCDREGGSEARHPQVPPVLSCDQTTTPPPLVIPTTSVEEVIPSLDETTTPAPLSTPSREAASTIPPTRAIPTGNVTPTTFSPITPKGVENKKPSKKNGKGLKKWFKSLNCFSCIE